MKSHILLFTSALGAVLFLASCGHKAKEQDALSESDNIPVKVASISSLQAQDKVSATGLITTENDARYSFKIAGVISKILVHEGQFFKKGQLLAALNNTEINSGLGQARLNVEKAQRDYTRALNLYKDSVSTLEQLQNAKTALDVAKKAEDAVAFNDRYSTIYAPTNGYVTQKIANEGEVIAIGAPVLAINETSGNNDYELKVGVTDKEWATINIGQEASVVLDGFPGKTFTAQVFRKSQASDNTGGAFQVELKLQLGQIKPAAGMFGKADIITGAKHTNTVIPYDALIEADGDKASVFELTADNKVKRVPIIVAGFDNQHVYVKSGLENVSRIIVSNSAFLNEQSQIKIIN